MRVPVSRLKLGDLNLKQTAHPMLYMGGVLDILPEMNHTL